VVKVVGFGSRDTTRNYVDVEHGAPQEAGKVALARDRSAELGSLAAQHGPAQSLSIARRQPCRETGAKLLVEGLVTSLTPPRSLYRQGISLYCYWALSPVLIAAIIAGRSNGTK
jgi:hypothetical protein